MDFVEGLRKSGVPFQKRPSDVSLVTAASREIRISWSIKLHFKIHDYSWDFDFLVARRLPVGVILGADFVCHSGMVLNPSRGIYHFQFRPQQKYEFLSNSTSASGKTAMPVVERPACSISTFIKEFPVLFSDRPGTVRGRTCSIELVDNVPVRSPPYQCSPPRLIALRQHVNDLLNNDVIKPSTSNYASPAFLVTKKEGKFRLVVDYRKLNQKVIYDSFPLPTIESAFQHFSGAKYFSVLDMNSAYYQIPLDQKSRKYTAFITPFGLNEFVKLPMGICVGGQILSREVDRIFGDIKFKFLFNYLDDLLVYSSTWAEHIRHLKEVFSRLQIAGFTLNPAKVVLGVQEISFLGHLLSATGIRVNPERVSVIKGFPLPRNLKQVRRFLGMAAFYSRFIPDFSRLSEPLNALKRKNAKFVWEVNQQRAYEAIKEALCQAPTLQIPNFHLPFVLQCDASDIGVSSVLNQEVGGKLAPIAFFSRPFSPAERNYSTYEKECLAVVLGCERFRTYLEHKEFVVHSDNEALSWMRRHPRQLGRIGRWLLRLSPFKFKVVHIRGSENVVADCLSRMLEPPDSPTAQPAVRVLQNLPASFETLKDHQSKDP